MQEQDVSRFVELMRSEWLEMVEREGTAVATPRAPVDPDGEPPCPCCGTAAPLVDGACSDCGLQLA